MDEIIKKINNTKRYFISNKGCCYLESKNGFKKINIPLNIIKGIPRVKIENKKLNLVLLLIEHFYDRKISIDFKYTWKVIDNKVPFDKIKIINYNSNSNDEKLIHQFKCDIKSYSANSRVLHKQKITSLDVLNVLKRNDFNCFYCGDKLSSKKWHLDHVYPISKGGDNLSTNLTSSCKQCNLMKGNMCLDNFYDKIKKIYTKIK